MTAPLVRTDDLESPSSDCGTKADHPALDPDEEEQAFIYEMMKQSRRATRREIELLFGHVEISE